MNPTINSSIELFNKHRHNANTNEYIELEIRIKNANRELFTNFYEVAMKCDESPTVEYTINISSKQGGSGRGKGNRAESRSMDVGETFIHCINAMPVRDSSSNTPTRQDIYMKKYRLLAPQQVHIDGTNINYHIAISRETITAKTPIAPDAIVRFKIRLSAKYGPWRLDLTAVKQCPFSDVAKILGEVRKNLYLPAANKTSATPATFLKDINYDMINSYEIEIEWVDAREPSYDDFVGQGNTIESLLRKLAPNASNQVAYFNEIRRLAPYMVPPNMIDMFKNTRYGFKKLRNQAIALNRTEYTKIYPPNGYLFTIKADGEGAILDIVIVNGVANVKIVRNTCYEEYSGVTSMPDSLTILDVEILVDSGTIVSKPTIISPNDNKNNIIRVFDVIVLNDKYIANEEPLQRIKHIPDAVKFLSEVLIGLSQVLTTDHCEHSLVNNSIKDTIPIPGEYNEIAIPPDASASTIAKTLKTQISRIWNQKYNFKNDGMILMAPHGSYYDTLNYKWKEYSANTIDFLAIKCPTKLMGVAPLLARENMTLYILFVGIDRFMKDTLGLVLMPHYEDIVGELYKYHADYFPIQFAPSANPLAYIWYVNNSIAVDDSRHTDSKDASTSSNNTPTDYDHQIVELSRNTDSTEWVFHRVRTDRKIMVNYYGNDYHTAEITYMNYIDKFTVEHLWESPSMYFIKQSDETHKAANTFKRIVINKELNAVINTIGSSGASYCMDIACGKGADLHRYSTLGAKHVLFMDIDAAALVELIIRKYNNVYKTSKGASKVTNNTNNNPNSNAKQSILKTNDQPITHPIIHTLVADLKSPYETLIADIYQFGYRPDMVNLIVCNFALHYMCDTNDHIKNILTFISRCLCVGGAFFFTVMDAVMIIELLKDTFQDDIWRSATGKYAIRREFANKSLQTAGQMIAVKLPFNESLVSEPLCNIANIVKIAKTLGMEVEYNESMSDYFGNIKNITDITNTQNTDVPSDVPSDIITIKVANIRQVINTKLNEFEENILNTLSEEDRQYISLFSCVVLRKTKDIWAEPVAKAGRGRGGNRKK